jgi:hypothetical protein
MTYQIRPVRFKQGVPQNSEIRTFIERNTAEQVCIQSQDCGHTVFFKNHPGDVLNFSRNSDEIIIHGDAGAAPALTEIFFSALISLGGENPHQLELVTFPLAEDYLRRKNRQIRALLGITGLFIWAVAIGLVCLVYHVINWVFISG